MRPKTATQVLDGSKSPYCLISRFRYGAAIFTMMLGEGRMSRMVKERY